MGVTVVVGGQFGSEGKGKVAYRLAERDRASAAVRVGGSNSGHTAVSSTGERETFRQLPTAALLDDVLCVLPAGSYIDVAVLLEEVDRARLPRDRLLIHPHAFIITEDDRRLEAASNLRSQIGSTNSGTGAAVQRRISRRHDSRTYLAMNVAELRDFVADTTAALRSLLDQGERVVIEGTQGFGLSVLHSPYYPFATSRDTTAAGAVSEAGLSPRDVDQVVLVLRSFPIRVAGNSGPLARETSWASISEAGFHDEPLSERTTVTGKLRRVAEFDPTIVRQAIAANTPDAIVLNHVDYLDAGIDESGFLTPKAREFVDWVQTSIEAPVDYLGLGPDSLLLFDRTPARVVPLSA